MRIGDKLINLDTVFMLKFELVEGDYTILTNSDYSAVYCEDRLQLPGQKPLIRPSTTSIDISNDTYSAYSSMWDYHNLDNSDIINQFGTPEEKVALVKLEKELDDYNTLVDKHVSIKYYSSYTLKAVFTTNSGSEHIAMIECIQYNSNNNLSDYVQEIERIKALQVSMTDEYEAILSKQPTLGTL